MLNLIHTDVLVYIVDPYLHYLSDLKNIKILFPKYKLNIKNRIYTKKSEEPIYWCLENLQTFIDFDLIKEKRIEVYVNNMSELRTCIGYYKNEVLEGLFFEWIEHKLCSVRRYKNQKLHGIQYYFKNNNDVCVYICNNDIKLRQWNNGIEIIEKETSKTITLSFSKRIYNVITNIFTNIFR